MCGREDYMQKIIRVFPRRTKWTPFDDLVFIGEPPIIGQPPDLPVFVSCVFTWDIPECERIYRSWKSKYSYVQLGGPAFEDPGGIFTPGRFIKNDVVFTSRGCPKDCPWCFAWRREGQNIRELPVTDGYIIQDNNILACSMPHILKVFNMLSQQKHAAVFQGGLDAELLTEQHADLLETIRIDRMFFSYDHMGNTYHLEKVAELLSNYNRDKKRCYVLCGYYKEDTPFKAEKRMLKMWDLGFMPFSMYYRNDDMRMLPKTKDWQDLTRIFSRPAIMRGYCNSNSNNRMGHV
jgi:hypothetical protein